MRVDPEQLDAWLAQIGLSQYYSQIKEYGYDSMLMLHEATEADIMKMIEDGDVKMKNPHRHAFFAKWKELVGMALLAGEQQEQEQQPDQEPKPELQPPVASDDSLVMLGL